MTNASSRISKPTIMAAPSEYDLVFYENSSPKRVSENLLCEKSAMQLLSLSVFFDRQSQFERFLSDFERRSYRSSFLVSVLT